jgi:hypothetical protein
LKNPSSLRDLVSLNAHFTWSMVTVNLDWHANFIIQDIYAIRFLQIITKIAFIFLKQYALVYISQWNELITCAFERICINVHFTLTSLLDDFYRIQHIHLLHKLLEWRSEITMMKLNILRDLENLNAHTTWCTSIANLVRTVYFITPKVKRRRYSHIFLFLIVHQHFNFRKMLDFNFGLLFLVQLGSWPFFIFWFKCCKETNIAVISFFFF